MTLVALLKRAFAVHVKTRYIPGWLCFSVSFIALFSVYHEKYTRSLGNLNTSTVCW